MPTSSWGLLIGGRGGTSLLVDKNHGWLSSSLLSGHLNILFPWFAHCVSKETQLLRRSLLSVSLYTSMLWTLVWASLCTSLCTKHYAWIIAFNSSNNPFWRWAGDWGEIIFLPHGHTKAEPSSRQLITHCCTYTCGFQIVLLSLPL